MFSLRSTLTYSLLGLTLAALPAAPSFAGGPVSITVPGTSDPWLAGSPSGTPASQDDFAPGQSPVEVTGLDYSAGGYMTFNATGLVSNFPDLSAGDPADGDPGEITGHNAGAENGIGNSTMPINALVGVFLGPDLAATAPSGFDFTSAASRDYLSLSPGLQQVFFIGDGLTSGNMQQKVFIPAGATRFYLGTMDGFEWINNTGAFQVTATQQPVPEASSVVSLGLLLLGGAGLTLRARRKAQAAV